MADPHTLLVSPHASHTFGQTMLRFPGGRLHGRTFKAIIIAHDVPSDDDRITKWIDVVLRCRLAPGGTWTDLR